MIRAEGLYLMEKVTGVVTDDLSSPLEGVTVLVDGSGITAAPDGPQATTNSQGVYTLENISIGTHIITFTKADYQTVSVTVVAGKFNEEEVAEVSPKMEYAAAKIKGKVVDAGKGNTPLERSDGQHQLHTDCHHREATVHLKLVICHWQTTPLLLPKQAMLPSRRR